MCSESSEATVGTVSPQPCVGVAASPPWNPTDGLRPIRRDEAWAARTCYVGGWALSRPGWTAEWRRRPTRTEGLQSGLHSSDPFDGESGAHLWLVVLFLAKPI